MEQIPAWRILRQHLVFAAGTRRALLDGDPRLAHGLDRDALHGQGVAPEHLARKVGERGEDSAHARDGAEGRVPLPRPEGVDAPHARPARGLDAREGVLDDHALRGIEREAPRRGEVHVRLRLAAERAVVVHDALAGEPAAEPERRKEEVEVHRLGGGGDGGGNAEPPQVIEEVGRARREPEVGVLAAQRAVRGLLQVDELGELLAVDGSTEEMLEDMAVRPTMDLLAQLARRHRPPAEPLGDVAPRPFVERGVEDQDPVEIEDHAPVAHAAAPPCAPWWSDRAGAWPPSMPAMGRRLTVWRM